MRDIWVSRDLNFEYFPNPWGQPPRASRHSGTQERPNWQWWHSCRSKIVGSKQSLESYKVLFVRPRCLIIALHCKIGCFFMYICQNKFFPAKFLFKGCFYFYRKSFNMYYNRYAVLRSGNKCQKKDLVRRKVFLFCALRSTLQFTFFFLNILGKSLIFALDDIGEIDFWGRK